MSRSDPANDAWQEFKADHPEAEQHWVFMFAYRRGQEDAAAAAGRKATGGLYVNELTAMAVAVGTKDGADDE